MADNTTDYSAVYSIETGEKRVIDPSDYWTLIGSGRYTATKREATKAAKNPTKATTGEPGTPSVEKAAETSAAVAKES